MDNLAPGASPAALNQADLDVLFMRHALAMGRRGMGRTWPNPSVGAVIVRDTPAGPVVIATGHTQPGGRPHAEAMAFDKAGLAATGATLYVTLEPCSHRTIRGATPCVERSLLAGVGRVVSATDDPNPRISGLSHAILRTAGIKVTTGILREDALRDHRGHVTRVTTWRPMVQLKLARTADGFAARADRQRLKITGPAADAQVHIMRARADAIMIGAGTAIADDPRLNVRLPGLGDRSPVRVVIDSDLGLAPFARNLIDNAREIPTWIVTSEDADVLAEKALRQDGVEVMRVARNREGRVDLAAALTLLGSAGLTRIFCEGGPHLAAALAEAHLIDEAILITGPARLDVPGEPALLPPLGDYLASMKPLTTRMAGLDRIETFERIA